MMMMKMNLLLISTMLQELPNKLAISSNQLKVNKVSLVNLQKKKKNLQRRQQLNQKFRVKRVRGNLSNLYIVNKVSKDRAYKGRSLKKRVKMMEELTRMSFSYRSSSKR